MKKNLVPLVGIAFVVAVISTAIFYSLISSRMPGSSVQATSGGAPTAALKPPDLGVPTGMRAVTVQVADSSGILAMLRPADRVDIQAVFTRASTGDVELRTVLQNVEVLKVNPEPQPSPGRQPLPVVTFLAAPADADTLALADSAARIRLALRNPDDPEKTPRTALGIVALIRSSRPAASAPSANAAPRPVLTKPEGPACIPQTPAALTPVPQP